MIGRSLSIVGLDGEPAKPSSMLGYSGGKGSVCMMGAGLSGAVARKTLL